MEKILTIDEVRGALFLDYDYPVAELERLSILASSILAEQTGYNWAIDEEKHPLAIQAAIQYIRMQFFDQTNYKMEFDYSLGYNALILHLQNIASQKALDQYYRIYLTINIIPIDATILLKLNDVEITGIDGKYLVKEGIYDLTVSIDGYITDISELEIDRSDLIYGSKEISLSLVSE
ncbi:MAG: hypothetical protein PF487_13395 [Bacteroidales bacterium]|jgi:hypothetical protein|nr:hypothetical protein [Bacteroidales bacterium]